MITSTPKKVIRAQKIPVAKAEIDPMTTLATLCYYYPQYTLAKARMLPYKHVVLLLRRAQQLEAARYYNLTQIAAAPHSKKGAGVKKLLSHFKKAMS